MAYKKIVLMGNPFQKESTVATAVAYPGYLLILASATTIKPHNVAGGPVAKMFAIENSLQGEDIDTLYAVGDRIQYVCPRPGDEILAVLKDGQNASAGSFLESAGDGTLQVMTPSSAGVVEHPSSLVAIALEAKNLTSSALGDVLSEKRIKVQIM